MQTTQTNLKELAAILAFDYLDAKAAIARVALATLNNRLEDDESFKASCELIDFGPANDWNGLRSAARRINKEWEDRILTPALLLHHKIKSK